MYKSLLCLNGQLPERKWFSRHEGIPLMAADGGANHLRRIGLTPDSVIGDLDSCYDTTGVKTIQRPSQEEGDFAKALCYLEEHGLLPTIVLGMNGGYPDHVLNNTSLFVQHTAPNLLYTPPMYGMALRPGVYMLQLAQPKARVSILALPHLVISSQGLKWELAHHKLTVLGLNSCSNQAMGELITLDVKEGVGVLYVASAFQMVGAT